jgi:hypothetical protein
MKVFEINDPQKRQNTMFVKTRSLSGDACRYVLREIDGQKGVASILQAVFTSKTPSDMTPVFTRFGKTMYVKEMFFKKETLGVLAELIDQTDFMSWKKNSR